LLSVTLSTQSWGEYGEITGALWFWHKRGLMREEVRRNLVKLTGTSRRTVQRALDILIEDRWIETRQIGQNGTVNAYVINDRVAWSGKRNGIRYSLFSATIIASDDEQPDRETLGQQEPLRKLPSLYRDEHQLPSGNGLPPPSEPALPGMEPDLPATNLDGDDA